MSRRAIIFHGTGGSPAYCWYSWLGQRLTERRNQAEVPHLPGINTEPIGTFLPKLMRGFTFDEDTVSVWHSDGAALLLALLEQLEVTVPISVLVAGYSTPLNDDRQGWALFDRLGGTQIIRPEGHSETPTLELVDRLIP
jgi:predicted alpha/beta hydrolase family esterase